MKNCKAKREGSKKLVKNGTPVSLKAIPENLSQFRLTSRKKPPSYIRSHKVKGKAYYYYCQGTEKEIYLGSAGSILKAVKGVAGSEDC